MIDKQFVAYLGPFSFPNGGAAARRILGNAKALRDGGYKVVIASGQLPENEQSDSFFFEGFKVESIGERTAEDYPNALRYLSYFNMGSKTVNWLDKLKTKPGCIILYSGYSPYLKNLLPWCKANGVSLIFDAVEWYDPKTVYHWLISPYHWNTELAMRYYIPRARNVISISRYLDNYYSRRSCQSVVVPPLVDLSLMPAPEAPQTTDILRLSYTGTPGYKDLFNEYLEAILELDPDGTKIRFDIAGVSKKQLVNYPAFVKRGLTSGHSAFNAKGLVPHSEAIDITKRSDFSLLLRKPLRFAMAGFPTKLVESLSLGTPLITNLTSDIGLYLENDKSSIICADSTVSSLRSGIDRALSLKVEDKISMRNQAALKAQQFDYRNYISNLSDLVKYAQPSI